jgi:hypothetical protein
MRGVMVTSIHEQDPTEVMKVCFAFLHTYRQLILQLMASEVNFSKCDLAALNDVWDRKIESKIVGAFGPAARSDAPPASKTKQCGPLNHALMAEWKQRVMAGQLRSVNDMLEAFTSAKMHEWHTRYAEQFLPIGVLPRKHKVRR